MHAQLASHGPMIVAILVGISAYIVMIALMPKRMLADNQYVRDTLQGLTTNKPIDMYDDEENTSLLRGQQQSGTPLSQLFFKFPFTKRAYPKLLKAGMTEKVGSLFVRCVIVFLIANYLLGGMFPISVVLSAGVSYLYGWMSINRQIRKRNNAFLNAFPDALDMIVRSVRSGYPMNSAVRMVADNMQAPVSTEFKQVADEIAYGSTLIEALQRLSARIDEPDVSFFVVVLTVQQDIGGNLSEVLNNLAGIIRKRKHLRMKIKALSSEGRTTAWVLGSMPFIEAALISLVSPDHLAPLFNTPLGNLVLMVTGFMVCLGIFIVNRMISIKV